MWHYWPIIARERLFSSGSAWYGQFREILKPVLMSVPSILNRYSTLEICLFQTVVSSEKKLISFFFKDIFLSSVIAFYPVLTAFIGRRSGGSMSGLIREAKLQFMKSRNLIKYAIKHFPQNSFLQLDLWQSIILVRGNNFERFGHKECRIGQIIFGGSLIFTFWHWQVFSGK